jgi:hypothetical protein
MITLILVWLALGAFAEHLFSLERRDTRSTLQIAAYYTVLGPVLLARWLKESLAVLAIRFASTQVFQIIDWFKS